jgi:hypothetical protein
LGNILKTWSAPDDIGWRAIVTIFSSGHHGQCGEFEVPGSFAARPATLVLDDAGRMAFCYSFSKMARV